MKKLQIIIAMFAIATMWMGCKKDKDLVDVPQPIVNEPEITTTIKLTFVDESNAANIKYATFRDPDGSGGVSYDIFDTIMLEPNITWISTILLLNETVSPADTISNEVLEEGVDHLFCYTPSGGGVTVEITDLDKNSRPIGLQSKWTTTNVGSGTMQIELKHQPDIKDGTCAPGNTDIDITFQTIIQ